MAWICERRDIALDLPALTLALRLARQAPEGPFGWDLDVSGQRAWLTWGPARRELADEGRLLAAILALCRARRIPVPMRAAKRITVRADGVALEIWRWRPADADAGETGATPRPRAGP